MYDLCIVGAGMIGSAAARYATLSPATRVCLIGPSEPKEKSSKSDRDIYGAYYDEGRITRCSDPVQVWAKLAVESIKRYRTIEEMSGISFYHDVGCVMVGSGTDSKYIKLVNDAAKANNVQTESCSSQNIQEQFSYLKLPEDAHGVRETSNAGFINPRKLVEAEQKLASKQGCTIIDDVVRKVERVVQSDGMYVIKVETECGKTVYAKSVLLCTGVFTRFRDLMPKNLKIEHKISPATVAFVEVETKYTHLLRDMPCLIYKGRRHKDWMCPDVIQPGDDVDFYMLPPIKYPDGRHYIKLGMTDKRRGHLETRTDVKQWFDKGNPVFQENIAEFIKSIFNGITFPSWKGDSCALMDTPTIRPYIDEVHDSLGVAIGDNGYAAKSCDEIGRLGASLMLNGWASELPQELFKIKFQNRAKL